MRGTAQVTGPHRIETELFAFRKSELRDVRGRSFGRKAPFTEREDDARAARGSGHEPKARVDGGHVDVSDDAFPHEYGVLFACARVTKGDTEIVSLEVDGNVRDAFGDDHAGAFEDLAFARELLV